MRNSGARRLASRGKAHVGIRDGGPAREQSVHVALLELAPDAIFVRGADRRITFWSAGAQNTYGYSSAEAIGVAPGDLLSTEYPVPLEEIEGLVAETGGWEGDLVQHAKDGRRMVVASRWAAQYDRAGNLEGLLEVDRDITARLNSQTALLDLLPDAIVGVSPDGLIALVNAQAEVLFGYAREELVGQAVEVLVPEALRQSHRSHRVKYVADPRTRPMSETLELHGLRRDGTELPVAISLSSIATEDSTLTIAAIRDVSERVRAARERERLEAEAERERLQNHLLQAPRLESLGQLAGGIAHDFNNLLAVIINYAAFVADDLETAVHSESGRRALREDVEQISMAAERAAHLTHQLLVFARREVIQPEVVDVNAVVSDIEQLLRRALGEHVELQSILAPDLCHVLIDPGQLEQILVNLAVNARDAMPGGGTLRIDTANVDVDETFAALRLELAPGPHVRLRVSDTGSGMSAETVQRAFDPFFTTKPLGQGTGLGLATVYGIIQRAGGRAQIYSELNVGTTFTVLLPATDRASSPNTPPQTNLPASRGEETILLVEDEPELREVTRRILVGAGYEVIAAANGPEALELASAHADPIDLLLSDVIMPLMPGPQLAKQLGAERPGLRVLLMSGFAQPILDAGGHLEDGVAFIEKPFSGPQLLAKIDQTLNRLGGTDARAAAGR
jgi:PAS domain S-box-containing protein